MEIGTEYSSGTSAGRISGYRPIAYERRRSCNITYTSGTTADPKQGDRHRNYTANVEQSLTCVDIDDTWLIG